MHQRSRTVVLARVAADAILIILAIFLAWYVRYQVQAGLELGEGFYYYPFSAYLPLVLFLTLLTMAILRIEGFGLSPPGLIPITVSSISI